MSGQATMHEVPAYGSHNTSSSSSSSPRRPRLMSSKDRNSSTSGSRSPRPRNALSEQDIREELDSSYDTGTHNEGSSAHSRPGLGLAFPLNTADHASPSSLHTRDSSSSHGGQGHFNESDFPSLNAGSSALSNFPGMSGIGLASQPLSSASYGRPNSSGGPPTYSSSPPVSYIQAAAAGVASHLPRFGVGASTSSTSTASASALGLRGRSRLSNSNIDVNAQDTPGSGSHGSHGSRKRQNSHERTKTGVSSGTSNSNSSTWSFFRSSSSANLAGRGQHSDSFSSVRERAEPMLSPITGTSGVTTPLVYDTGHTTPVGVPSALNDELRRRIAVLRDEGRVASRSYHSYSSSFVISEGSSSHSSSSGGSFLSAAKRKSRKASISGSNEAANPPIRKAEGLVAMAEREANTAESVKVVVAGRNLLKILNVTRPGSEDHSEDDAAGSSSWSSGRYRADSSSRIRSRQRSTVRIDEESDLQAGLLHTSGKNSKAALINDVAWGYDYTAEKIMTGNSNGTVALYDIGKGGSKLERLKTHHQSGRAINVISFAGPSGQGTLLASGCQDGDIKLSDVRHASLITLASPLDPIRSFCFAPRRNSTADPFQLISAYESGNIARWDLRMPKNPVERLMAHHGGVLSIDWKGGMDATGPAHDTNNEETRSAPGHSWGWLATAGMDGTVKIWDMSASSHTPQLTHTLHITRPAHFVRWSNDPNNPCDVVVTPTPVGSTVGTFDESWQPDIEIWDVRREHLPKQSFWTGGSPVSCLSPVCTPEALWCLSRKTSAFLQVDIEQEAVQPIDYVPKVALAWSPEGTLAFAVGSSRSSLHKVDEMETHPCPADSSSAVNQATGVVPDFDPSFDTRVFRYLAEQYQFKTDPGCSFASICRVNAEAAMEVNRYDTAKIWRLLEQWIVPRVEEKKEPVSASIPSSPHVAPAQPIRKGSPSLGGKGRTRSRTSPSNAFPLLPYKDAHPSRQSSPLVTSQVVSEADLLAKPIPLKLPPPKTRANETNDSNNVDLVGSDTSNSSSVPDDAAALQELDAGLNDEVDMPVDQPSSRRMSEDRGSIAQVGVAASLPAHLALKRRPLLANLANPLSTSSSRTVTRSSSSSNTALPDSLHALPRAEATTEETSQTESHSLPGTRQLAASGNRFEHAMAMSRQTSQRTVRKEPDESSASDLDATGESDIDDEEYEFTAESLRARTAKHHKVHRRRMRARQSRSKSRRRAAGGAEETRRTVSGRHSRSVSANRHGYRSISKIRGEVLQAKVLAMADEARSVLNERFGEHLKTIMQGLADEGDVQTSATIALAVHDHIPVDHKFLARITSAYLALLRRLDCHLTSAKVTKTSTIESVQTQSQDNTTIRTACGNCEKGIHNAPFAKCTKCRSDSTICSICHIVGTGLWIFCSTCGHGAHEDCLYSYASEVSHTTSTVGSIERVLSALPTPSTVPNSPHLAGSPGSGHWLFPSEHALFTPASALQSRLQSRAASPEVPDPDQNALLSRALLLSQCPSGCGHSCLLTLPLSELPEPMWAF